MDGSVVARIAWDLPNGEETILWMQRTEAVYFGRAADCNIQMGRIPYDPRVPSVWGRFSWDRRLRVENLAERVARWSFSLHPVFAPDGPRDESPLDVAPGTECSLSSSQFEVRATAPGGLGNQHVIRVNALRVRNIVMPADEAPSVVDVALTPSEKRIGRALIRPLEEGRAAPATYGECAEESNFSREGARDALERIDAKLANSGLYGVVPGGTTPERVARALLRHRHLLV